MNAYLWHVEGNLRHHLRAETETEARERIAATHGYEIARRAVIRPLEKLGRKDPQPAAA